MVCSQLIAAALVNYSLRPPFFEQLGSVAVGAALRFMDSPSVDESIKTDILKMIYNLVCRSDTSRFRVVEADGMAVLWRYVKNQEDEVNNEQGAKSKASSLYDIDKHISSYTLDPTLSKHLPFLTF